MRSLLYWFNEVIFLSAKRPIQLLFSYVRPSIWSILYLYVFSIFYLFMFIIVKSISSVEAGALFIWFSSPTRVFMLRKYKNRKNRRCQQYIYKLYFWFEGSLCIIDQSTVSVTPSLTHHPHALTCFFYKKMQPNGGIYNFADSDIFIVNKKHKPNRKRRYKHSFVI